jgi:hypothetical protein
MRTSRQSRSHSFIVFQRIELVLIFSFAFLQPHMSRCRAAGQATERYARSAVETASCPLDAYTDKPHSNVCSLVTYAVLYDEHRNCHCIPPHVLHPVVVVLSLINHRLRFIFHPPSLDLLLFNSSTCIPFKRLICLFLYIPSLSTLHSSLLPKPRSFMLFLCLYVVLCFVLDLGLVLGLS